MATSKRLEEYRIAKCGGTLCVAYTSSSFNRPEIHTVYWPIRAYEREDAAHLGQVVVGSAQHGYQYRDDMGNWTRAFMLRDGGATASIHTETVEYLPPKVRAGIETRYQSGKWQKYLKTRGWVDA